MTQLAHVGRNDPCPCGSGRKYKVCCLPRAEAVETARDGVVGTAAEITVLDAGPAPDAGACLRLLAGAEVGCWFDRRATGGISLLMVDPDRVLRSACALWPALSASAAMPPGPFGFAGGWAGWISFEGALTALGLVPNGARAAPDVVVARYGAALAIDHARGIAHAVGRGPGGEAAAHAWLRRLDRLGRAAPLSYSARAPRVVDPGPDRTAFVHQVRQVQHWIRAGETYVANLTYRVRLEGLTDPPGAYARLAAAHPAPYAALLHDGDRWVLSSSPELLLERRAGLARTRPIKGTRAVGEGVGPSGVRATSGQAEAVLSARPGSPAVPGPGWVPVMPTGPPLAADPKERAELTMIVDMERNDLGQVARTGSVRVTELFGVERHPGLEHLIATVEADVPVPACDLLRAMLPGGSVTGAPKRRTVELLAALEVTPRGVYTGSAGYCDDGGDMEWNVAIRTLEVFGGRCLYGTGGGITSDSDPDREYAETRLKARGPLRALGVPWE